MIQDNNSLVGETLQGRYLVTEILGKGGFGVTYKAKDTTLVNSPPCVVKHLKPQNQEPNALLEAKKLFEKEAVHLYKLGNDSKQIPTLFAYFEEDGEFYLVQEFVEGHNLASEIIKDQPLNEEAVVKLLNEILEILVYVHSHNIIHRDLKPENIMRRKIDGKIMLIDFGAVKRIRNVETDPVTKHYMTTAIVGTPGYMPIEQQGNEAEYCSDIYAVGIIAIQALTGLNIEDIRKLPKNEHEIEWRHKAPNISKKFAEVIEKMVRYSAAERYKSVSETLKALNNPIINLDKLAPEYTPLLALLENERWQEADAETVNLMLKKADRKREKYMNIESLQNFPCDVLELIDDLWVKYSKGKFGFSIQARIWKEITGGSSQPDNRMYRDFGKRVGWVKQHEVMWYGDNMIFDLKNAPDGHLPVGRFGNISLGKKIIGRFGGFGLKRVTAMVEKFRQCKIIE